MGANRPERRRLEVMICVMLRAIVGSGSGPPTKSGSAIGIGWMWPSVIVIRGAARTRDHRPPPAMAARDRPAAPAKRRRRESVSSGDRMFRFPIAPGFDEQWQSQIRPPMSAAEHLERIEVDRKLLPNLVFRKREHRVGLARNDGADSALDHGLRIRVAGPHLHSWVWLFVLAEIKRPILSQPDRDRNHDLSGGGRPGGRIPAIPEVSPEGVDLAQR